MDDAYDCEGAVEHLTTNPSVWFDGSVVRDEVSDVCAVGAVFLPGCIGPHGLPDGWVLRMLLIMHLAVMVGGVRSFVRSSGPLQNEQRAETCGVIFAWQAGDSLNVVRNACPLLDGFVWPQRMTRAF